MLTSPGHRSLPLLAVSPGPKGAPAPAQLPALPPRSARLSLTDRCDMACVYCRPESHDTYLDDRLSDGAFRAVAEGLVRAGIERVRITGGEPLLHPRAVEMVRFLRSLGIADIALTTNGARLGALAAPLREAGLSRVTISLDSLDEARFARITRGGRLPRVLAGIEAARAAGFDEVKTNAVVLRSENLGELPALTTWAWARGVQPRFIEVMKIGEGARIDEGEVVPVSEMRALLAPLLEDERALVDPERGPARYVHARRDRALRVGFISGASDTFCDSCDRLRVSSDGMLRPCLATSDGESARAAADASDVQAIADAVAQAWKKKPDGRVWKGCTEESASLVSMRAIGG